MSTTYYPDFSKLSNYNPDSGVIAVRYAADAPLTEVELNEIQLIQNAKRKELVKYFVKDGLSKDGTIKLANGVLRIENKHAFVDGYHVFIDSVNINVANGQSVYLNVYENQQIGPNDQLKKYGNVAGNNIDNYIMDTRYNQEISKRIVLCYELGTSQKAGAKSLKICTVSSTGTVTWNYGEAGVGGGEAGSTKDYLYANAREIPFTPAELKTKRESGDFSGLEVGDYVTIQMEGELAGTTLHFELAGMDVYYGHSTDYKHSLDFVVREVVMKHRMHSENNTIGGLEAMELYTYLQTTIWNCIPQAWRDVIVPKKVLIENKTTAVSINWDWKSFNLWFLSDIELFGYQSWSAKGYGSGNFKQYPLFRSERHLIKKLVNTNSAWWYWLLQPVFWENGSKTLISGGTSKMITFVDDRSTTYWCHCNYGGVSSHGHASGEDGGVVFGFRI